MASESISSDRIRARQSRGSLQRPRLGPSCVARPRLVHRLSGATTLPVTTLIAPAGYGKTTAVLEWLSSEPTHSAWLSVDETDDDLQSFAIHVVSALQTVAPEIGARTLALLDMQSPVSPRSLGATLADDCLDLEWDLILVLDDLHHISSSDVQEFFEGLLRHPAPSLHIVATSRVETLLPLPSLRARDHVLEIRATDLRFDADEISLLVEAITGEMPDLPTIARLQELTQGWVACVRLAALAPGALSASPDPIVTRHLADFLVEEVLARQPADLQSFLLRTSIVVELSAPLAATLLEGAIADAEAQRRLEYLVAAGLLTSPIGPDRIWFRYHNVFRDLLVARLHAGIGVAGVRALHLAASKWLAGNDRLEAAVAHALLAEDAEFTGSIVATAAFKAVDSETWSDLSGLLALLPSGHIERRTDLLVLRCWANYHQDNLAAFAADLDLASKLITNLPPSAPRSSEVLHGHILAFEPYTRAEYDDVESTLASAESTLQTLPASDAVPRGLVLGHVARRLSIAGQPDRALEFLAPHSEFTDLRHAGSAARALAAGVGVHINGSGDYDAAERPLRQILALGKTVALPILSAFATTSLAWIALRRLDPRQAIPLLESVVNRAPAPTMITWRGAMYGLALARFMLGRPVEANSIAARVVAFATTSGNHLVLENARSFQARIWLLQGDRSRAAAWVESIAVNPDFEAPFHQESIALTRARTLLAIGGDANLTRAREQIEACKATGAALRIHPFLTQTSMVEALLEDLTGHREHALELLSATLDRVAEQRDYLPVVELGSEMATLLRALPGDHPHADVATGLAATIDSRIWASALADRSTPDRATEVPATGIVLTSRETQVLQLLQQRLSNKEIASALSISPLTVKRHSAAIFQKLGVGRRREAVGRAVELGMLRRT